MNEFSGNLTDLKEQLNAIDKMSEVASNKLKKLNSTIVTFTGQFSSQEGKLTELYKKTDEKQNTYKNIVTVRESINNVLNKLNTNQRLSAVFSLSIEHNFDQFMNAFREVLDAKEFIHKNLYFHDAVLANEELTETTKKNAAKILDYFVEMAKLSATSIPASYFTFDEDGNFVNIIKEYNEEILYPFSADFLDRMKEMAAVFNQLDTMQEESGTRLLPAILKELNRDRHTQVYIDEHSKSMNESLKSVIEESKIQPPIESSMNILSLPTYKARTHSIHIFCNALCFFLKRELQFAKRVFGEAPVYIKEEGKDGIFKAYEKPFESSIELLFKNFIKAINSLMEKEIFSQVDILFYLDVVRTISQLCDEISKIPDLGKQFNRIHQCQHSFYYAIQKVLDNYKPAVRNHDKDEVPPSGGVTAVVSNVIIFLASLGEYELSVKSVLGYDLSTYVNTILDNLRLNVKDKSKHYTDPVLCNLFLMNNAHYAYMAIEGNKTLKKLVNQEIIQDIEKVIQDAQREYMNLTWNKAFAILAYDNAFDGYKKPTPLNRTQKKIIKSKFKDFKDAVMQIQQKHSSYCLKNKKLLAPIMNDAISKTKVFEAFYSKWHDTHFAKHPEKYIVVQPITLEGIITRMYGNQKTNTK